MQRYNKHYAGFKQARNRGLVATPTEYDFLIKNSGQMWARVDHNSGPFFIKFDQTSLIWLLKVASSENPKSKLLDILEMLVYIDTSFQPKSSSLRNNPTWTVDIIRSYDPTDAQRNQYILLRDFLKQQGADLSFLGKNAY
ncbi:MAG: hypothetical protein H6774_03575 [Pseudomonadales bacterium]|nr:hypothetical protein [Pseudomonadales bacterium]